MDLWEVCKTSQTITLEKAADVRDEYGDQIFRRPGIVASYPGPKARRELELEGTWGHSNGIFIENQEIVSLDTFREEDRIGKYLDRVPVTLKIGGPIVPASSGANAKIAECTTATPSIVRRT